MFWHVATIWKKDSRTYFTSKVVPDPLAYVHITLVRFLLLIKPTEPIMLRLWSQNMGSIMVTQNTFDACKVLQMKFSCYCVLWSMTITAGGFEWDTAVWFRQKWGKSKYFRLLLLYKMLIMACYMWQKRVIS